MKVGILFTKEGLKVTFRDISREVPVGSQYHWDFGDSNVDEGKEIKVHTYEYEGFYQVTLTVTPTGDGEPQSASYIIGVSDKVKTTLSDTIYFLIDNIVPKEFVPKENYETSKRLFIEKWQLYLQCLVNHEIPEEQFNNELYYEALENQLIMELATYDWVSSSILSLIGSLSQTGQSTGDSEGEVKSIVTGPSEVEFFSNSDINYKTLIAATKKDGVLDVIRKNLCMLSERLEIYLPICTMTHSSLVVPEVANKRVPGPLGGPNPTYPLNK